MLGPGNTDNTANVGGAFPTWTLNVLGFAAPAPSFTIHIRGQDGVVAPGMTLSGGVINFSLNNQFLEVDPGNSFTPATPGSLHFTQNAFVLGGGLQINNNGGTAVGGGGPKEGGMTTFSGTSAAGQTTINNFAAAVSPVGSAFATAGQTVFEGSALAGTATINNVGGALQFTGGGTTTFKGSSDAVSATITNTGATAANARGGLTSFQNTATAGGATILNGGSATTGSLALDFRGQTSFSGNASAGHANITNAGGASAGGLTSFGGTSTASSSTIVNNGGGIGLGQGGQTSFNASSNAGASTLIANAGAPGLVIPPNLFILGGLGGVISFNQDSTGGTARVEVFGNGGIDISRHNAPGVTIGSLEGSGFAALGGNNLSVGSNNRSTTFSGTAQDGGSAGGIGGSLTKIGTGTLTLSGNNTYTGATTVNAGKLIVDGSIASSSSATVAAGATLGGHGNVSNLNGAGTIAPGDSPGILTATQVNPSAGMAFTFELTKTGSPTYSNAAASGNDLLHLAGLTPFTTSLTSANQITIDFSGASLAAGQSYLGGFFTDFATATSIVSGANFVYTGTAGFTVTFDGFVVEPIADFASGTILNGTVLEFDISGPGTSVPEPPTGILLLLALSAMSALRLAQTTRVGRAKT
jgi:autotransporter-associated beta strand protein